MVRKTYEELEVIRQKSSMSQKIVANKDPAYALYAGASFEVASKMALIDALKALKLIPEPALKYVEQYRTVLDLQRKAFLGSNSSEITKLGFLLGLKSDKINVT